MARRFLGGIDLLNQLVTAIGAQMSTGKLLGRSTAGSGAIEEISIGSGLSLSGGTLSATGGGGGGLTKFTEAESTSAPNATVYVDSLTAAATSTNADVALVAKGSGSTLAQVPDGTTAGGNKRGQYATDLQKSRSAATNVASGSYSTILGGANNTASSNYSFIGGGQSNTAQTNTHATVCGGNGNTASGAYSFVGGGQTNICSATASAIVGGTSHTCSAGTSSFIGAGANNTLTGYYSFIGAGRYNNVPGYGAFVGAGTDNFADGDNSSVIGGRFGTVRGITGNVVISTGDRPIAAATGVSQTATLLLGRQTTTNTATVLTSDTSAASTNNQVILPNNSAYSFSGEVIAGVTGAGNTARWTINGAIKRGASAATTAMVGTPTVTMTHNDAGAAAWTVAVTADTTNGGIKVEVTGAASTTIRWVCCINTVEVTY